MNKKLPSYVNAKRASKRVYISGPMSNLTREQYMELFRRAEQSLRAQGYTKVVNPIRVWACRWPWLWKVLTYITSEHTAYTLVLLYDLWLLSRCDLIYKLPGWRESRGASVESAVSYYFKIWTIPLKTRERIDKKLVNAMTKWREKYAATLKCAELDEDGALKCAEQNEAEK